MKQPVVAAVVFAVVGVHFDTLAIGQSADPVSTTTNPAVSHPDVEAERAKIWNSPQMLRARAWLKEHDADSAKVTPEEAKEHQEELANLTPKQMKLWLLKFQHEDEIRQQQQALFNAQRQAQVQQAMAAHQQMKQAYANINADANQAAKNVEGSIQQQQEFAQQDGLQKNADRDAAVNNLLAPPFLGWGAYGYGYGGVHYHFY
jgi:hypothetical protein